jgi:hypothetical protein
VHINDFRQLRHDLVRLVKDLGDGSTLYVDDCRQILSELIKVERAAAAGKLNTQRRAVSAQLWKAEGAPSPETWLAGVTGETPSDAARSLAAGEQIAELPRTALMLAEGELSQTQASLVASGASADPRQSNPFSIRPDAQAPVSSDESPEPQDRQRWEGKR